MPRNTHRESLWLNHDVSTDSFTRHSNIFFTQHKHKMSATEFQLNHLEHLLHSPRSALKPGDPAYDDDTKTWGAQRALKPRLVLKPESMGEVQALTQYLASQSDLDFVVRNGGVGSASSEDVQISLSNFKDIRFDEGEEAVYVGAGCLWEDLDSRFLKSLQSRGSDLT